MRLQEIAYHRNGVCGEPFYVVRFSESGRNMLAVVFEHPEDETPTCPRVAVLDVAQVAAGVIAFGENSHRGDRYAARLRLWIAEHEREQAEAFAAEVRS